MDASWNLVQPDTINHCWKNLWPAAIPSYSEVLEKSEEPNLVHAVAEEIVELQKKLERVLKT